MDPKTKKIVKHIEELEARIRELQHKDHELFNDLAPLVEKIINEVRHPEQD